MNLFLTFFESLMGMGKDMVLNPDPNPDPIPDLNTDPNPDPDPGGKLITDPHLMYECFFSQRFLAVQLYL
jgi:hypothetical protein